MKLISKNAILIACVVVLAFGPLYIARDAEFAGADARASDAISTINPNYTSWFEPLWTPPSGEVEAFIFALQAAIGSGFVFYFFGYSKGKYKGSMKDQT